MLLRRLLPPQRLPNRLDHDRDAVRLAHDRLHADSVQPCRLLLPHPARHHQHLGVELTPGLEQPLDHLQCVQIRQPEVEHDQGRPDPADFEQRVHAVRRLHHLHPQVRLLDRLRERLEIRMVVVHHDDHVAPDRIPQVRGHWHLARPQELHQLGRLDSASRRRRLVPLEQTLVDPVRHCRRRHLADPRHALRAPIFLRSQGIHGIRNTPRIGTAQDPSRHRRNRNLGSGKIHTTGNIARTRDSQGPRPEGELVVGWLILTPYVRIAYLLASVQRLVASNTASTALRSALSRISHVPVSNCASRPPRPCTATSTNLRSNASTSVAPSSALELSGNSSSRHVDAARAAASTRFRTVSVPCSSASASRPSNDSFTRTITRCGRSEGRTSSPWKMTTRFLARVRTASSCISSIGRTSAVCATLILRWSIFRPSCAISADSMLRTTCFACWSLVVSTWISLTSPSGVTTTRAESTPVRLVIRFSARFTPT